MRALMWLLAMWACNGLLSALALPRWAEARVREWRDDCQINWLLRIALQRLERSRRAVR